MKKMSTLVRPREGRRWISFLKRLTDFLNLRAAESDYWLKAETIVTDWLLGKPHSLQRAIDTFNSWAAKKPFRLYVTWRQNRGGVMDISATMDFEPGEQMAIEHLWSCFFANPDRYRLKRCPQCRKWFVDETRNGAMIRCSPSCTNKWWTLERRQEAGHRLPGVKRQAKRRAKP